MRETEDAERLLGHEPHEETTPVGGAAVGGTPGDVAEPDEATWTGRATDDPGDRPEVEHVVVETVVVEPVVAVPVVPVEATDEEREAQEDVMVGGFMGAPDRDPYDEDDEGGPPYTLGSDRR